MRREGFYIDDSSSISLVEIRAKTRKLMLKYGIKMIIVDYLQLITGIGQNREQEVSYLSRGLKSIARDLDLPVIVLSQLNRRSEERANNMPKMSDLRESGAIEQDADTILLIFRPALYGMNYTEIDGIEKSTKGLMFVNLAKCRNGCTGEIELCHNESVTKIYDPD